MSKKSKAIISFMLSLLVVFLCIPGISAVLSPKEEESYHTPGGLFLNVKADAPSLEELFEGYEIERADLIKTVDLRPGYTVDCAEFVSSDDETLYEIIGYIYHIWLVDETREVLEEVVEKLLLSPYVNGATVNNYMEAPQLPITTPDEPTVPTVPATPEESTPDYREPAWYPGIVIVALRYNAPSVEELLEGFEIEEVSFVTNLGHSQLFFVKLCEETETIVGKAIKKLSTSPYVVSAAPDYIHDWGEYEGDTVYWCAQRGDTNSDGKIDVRDATAIQKWLVGIKAIDLIEEIGDDFMKSSVVGDFDFDGKITVRDATAIQKRIAGII
ncbi:MAG: dockerin type I repeat-containing protein [Ruminococcus sp.]|nr:dockerin type I repeat-containing protein [Ruminococcus sp.]